MLSKISSLSKKLHIELSPEYVEEARKSLNKEYCKFVELPGFRKGKAPMEAVRKKFLKEFEEDLKKTLIDSELEKAVKEQKLKSTDTKITEACFKEDGSFCFVITSSATARD